MDSAPPASTTSASPTWMAWAAETIACTPVPQRRLTVNAGASLGTPALIPTTRAMYMSSGAVWMTLPNTTCSTCSGSSCARSMAARAAVAPSSVAGTSRRLLPNPPIAVGAAEAITTSRILGLLWGACGRRECYAGRRVAEASRDVRRAGGLRMPARSGSGDGGVCGSVDGWEGEAGKGRVGGAYDVLRNGTAKWKPVLAREEGRRRPGVIPRDRSAEAGWRAAHCGRVGGGARVVASL